MKKSIRKSLPWLAAFILWTVFIRFVDVQTIGPGGSAVGLAAINLFIHNLTGTHMVLYELTDWLGLIPLMIMLFFATLGLIQWIRKRSLTQVDKNLLALGGFYLAVLSVYILFELLIINYRPVLINGVLEASYPSSTTMLVLCVMPTANMQIKSYVKNQPLQRILTFIVFAFTVFMVVCRLISGVHWFTDIVGGCLISASLITLYSYASRQN